MVQIIEMGAPVIVAPTWPIWPKTKGLKIDIEKLALGLGVAVIPTIAREGDGLNGLSDAIVAALAPKEESR